MSAEENSFNLISLNNDNRTASDDKISMPYNLEAEQSLLGAILFDNTTLEKIMDSIKQTFHSLLSDCIGFIARVEEIHKQSHNKIQ